jgi:hypothetical protein
MTDHNDTSTSNEATKEANMTKVGSSAELPMFVGSANLVSEKLYQVYLS